MQKHFLTLLIALPLLALGTLTACENDEEMTGLEDAQAAALAQADGQGAERHLAMLQEELELTDAQVTQLRAIFEEKHEKFQALHESVSQVLTEEQEQRLHELRASGGPHGSHGERDPERHLARLREDLDLTDAQVAELRAIFEDQRQKIEALGEGAPEGHERMRAVLTEEQRQRLEELMKSRGPWHRGS